MRAGDETYYNLKRLHLVFAVSSIALLAATVWLVWADHAREWKVYQRAYRDRAGGPSRPPAIQQIWLPELKINYNFCKVARFDRCTTCHLGIDEAAPAASSQEENPRELPQPFRSHPRLDLFVGPQSAHPVEKFGCTICHQGQGSATAMKFASHTPNDPQQRRAWQKQHGWFWSHDWDYPMRPARFVESSCLACHHDVVELEPTRRFPDPPAPKLLAGYHLVRENGCFGCHEIKGVTESGRRVGPDMRLEPGTMRKVGPSLRDVAGRLDRAFVEDWLRQPSRFRPETRMPQFFGMHEHLEGSTLAETRRLEAVEVRAATEYLFAASQLVPPLPGADATAEPSAERGKKAFETQGCLACHKHKDFPEAQASQGPDLSNLGAKYRTEAGAKWVVSWLRDPVRHSPRTAMPNPLLESGVAEDVAAYLLGARDGQPPKTVPVVEADLSALALEHLSKTYPQNLAEQYLREGIPASMAGTVQGDAVELLGPMTGEKKSRYVGRRTIRKRGCYGCHDIPGFENAPPIGPALSDWGRKQESLLAFEQVDQFLAKHPDEKGDPDGFYREAILSKRREGFLWQKLGAPRSFDYQKAQSKGFNEHLLMGRFTFSAKQREAIMTFVLGLVGEPPAETYVYQPDRRRRAIIEGRKVLDRHGCALCHTLEMERWKFRYRPDEFEGPVETEDFEFLTPELPEDALEASKQTDRRGMGEAEIVGVPRVDAAGELMLAEGDEEDENGDPLPLASFTLWEPAAVNGEVWRVGGADPMIYEHQIIAKRPAWGGDFARLLYPRALADAKARGATASEIEAWGWVPPPLVHEGSMVQPAWLHEYLLDPRVIRPAAVLRMPKYNLSADEAGKLVDYFAAASGADFPYAFDPHVRPLRRESMSREQADRLDRALRLVTDRTTYCAKCHLIGDFSPGGQTRTILAPDLERVGRRIRPEYVRRWLANPKSVLPYTAMPVNFPPTGPPMGQDLYPGSSLEQLEAVTDLLLNYDEYVKHRQSIRAMMPK